MSNNDTAQNQSTLPFTDCSHPTRPLRGYRTGSDVREKREAMDAAAKEIREGWLRADSDHDTYWNKMDCQFSAPESENPTISKHVSTNTTEIFDKFDEKTQSQQKTSMESSPTTTSWKDKVGAKISNWSTSIGVKR